jgi:glycine betaine/proline transport system ATP-binding protein
LQDELLELQERLHKTIVFVSHDLDEALKLGTRIAIMQDARIIQVGRPEEIVARPATPYVRDFVQNVNPLNVLTAWNLMRDVRDLEPAGEGGLWLDRRRSTAVDVDPAGRPATVRRNEALARFVELAPGAADAMVEGAVGVARPSTPMRDVIAAMHGTSAPLALVDDTGRLVGSIGMRDVLRAILRRPQQASLT